MDHQFAQRLRSASSASSSVENLSQASRAASTVSGLTSEGHPSPKKSDRIYGDRFIPSRSETDLATAFALRQVPEPRPRTLGKRKAADRGHDSDTLRTEEANRTFNALLKTELFGKDAKQSANFYSEYSQDVTSRASTSSSGSPRRISLGTVRPSHSQPGSPPRIQSVSNLLSFASPSRKRAKEGAQGTDSPDSAHYSISPVSTSSQRLLLSPRKPSRQFSKVPFKVLDAPDLADDFYLNLVDWSPQNMLGVGLGGCVYLWSAATSKVTKLCDVTDQKDTITSVSWEKSGPNLAVGLNSGKVEIWDTERGEAVRTIHGHAHRVGAMAWNDHVLTTGSRDRTIVHRDVRAPAPGFRTLTAHKQEICGLKWSPDGSQLASGGNDNKLMVWQGTHSDPLWKFTEHTAAVKAISWSPHQTGILASGGGTADRKIRFWNTITGKCMSEIDTGTQICNILFSPTSSEIVSTHGYSSGPNQNHICVWKYPQMQQVATLTGHSMRVLYLAASPDGRTIVTGAGDETLRFWDCFKPAPKESTPQRIVLDPISKIR